MFIRWSGAGCLLYLLALLALPAAYGVTRVTIAVTGSRNASLQAVAVAGMLLLFGVVAFLIGWLLNARGDRHTLNGMPMQTGAFFFPFVSLALLCFALGAATSAWVGLAVLLLVIVGLFQMNRLPNMIVEVGRTRDRLELARRYHWRWARRDAALRRRWTGDDGKPTYGRGAYGILAGEIDGMPFTAYDTFRVGLGGARQPLTRRVRNTVWVVHLPVAYPSLRLTADGPRSSDRDFAEAIWTAPVYQATQARGQSWWITGRDLITVRHHSDPSGQTTFPAEQVIATAAALVALARSFPPDLPTRFGSAATTDVPLSPSPR